MSTGGASASAERLLVQREEAASCRACRLWEHATQTVFGEGPVDARLMMVASATGRPAAPLSRRSSTVAGG